MIRPATATDLPEIAAIWNLIIRETLFTFTTEDKTESGLAPLLTGPTGHPRAFVASKDQTILGFAIYGQFRSGPGYARTMEHSIHLLPGARGKGLGAPLLAAAEAAARDEGAHQMIAGVSSANPGGAGFHARQGYRLIATLPEVGFKWGRTLDLLLMQKFLT